MPHMLGAVCYPLAHSSGPGVYVLRNRKDGGGLGSQPGPGDGLAGGCPLADVLRQLGPHQGPHPVGGATADAS